MAEKLPENFKPNVAFLSELASGNYENQRQIPSQHVGPGPQLMTSQPYGHCLKSSADQEPGVCCGCDVSVGFLIVPAGHLQLTNIFLVSKGLTTLTGWQGFTGKK